MPKEKGLTNKQQVFVQEYCSNGFNASQAYKTAYPNCKTGYQQAGSRMLLNAVIEQAIEDKKAEIQAENVANRQQRQQFWTRVMLGLATGACNMGDRLRASELLGKSEADFTDKYQDTGLEQRQRQLTEAEQAEAKRIAQIRLRQG